MFTQSQVEPDPYYGPLYRMAWTDPCPVDYPALTETRDLIQKYGWRVIKKALIDIAKQHVYFHRRLKSVKGLERWATFRDKIKSLNSTIVIEAEGDQP